MNVNQMSRIATLIGEPARTAMLCSLLSGQALTATELANSAGITAQTASRHLSLLVENGLLSVHKQGRHRYHRLASPNVANVLDSIIRLSVDQPPPRPVFTGPRDKAMRKARTCYDHIAGRLGVAITESMVKMQWVRFEDEAGTMTQLGVQKLAALGIDTNVGTKSSRLICRPCMDWSERRCHIAGRVGAAICEYLIAGDYLRRVKGSRALEITATGVIALREIFDIDVNAETFATAYL